MYGESKQSIWRVCGAALASALFCTASASAQSPGYKVQAEASVNSDAGASALYDYNVQYINTPYFAGSGSFDVTTPCNTQYGGSCQYYGSDPNTPNPNLTSAEATAYASSTEYNYFGTRYYGQTAAAAYANLADGTLGVSGSSTPSYDAGQSSPTSNALTSLSDTLTFAVPNATDSTVTDVQVNFNVYGNFVSEGANLGEASLRAILYFGNGQYDETLYDPNGSNVPTLSGCCGASGWVSDSYTLSGSTLTFSGIYALEGADPSLGVFSSLTLECSAGYACDYYHTGVIEIVAPAGVTYGSASGVFLSQPFTEGAPEPAGWALLLAGCGLAGGGLRRARRRNAVRAAACG